MNRFTSLLSEWFLGGDQGLDQPLSVTFRLLLFCGFLAAGFALIYPICWLLEEPLASILATGSQAAGQLVSPWIEFSARGHDVYFKVIRRPRLEAWTDSRLILSNLPLLVTLVLVTPGMRWQRRIFRTIAAVALLFATHVAFVITKAQVVLIHAEHPLAGSPAIWSAVDDFFEVVGKTFFPILIWLALCLPYMLGAEDKRQDYGSQALAIKRNDPCPCGSGKKYKKCCLERRKAG